MSFVIKRDGRKEPMRFDKITERIEKLICPDQLKSIELPYLDLESEPQYLDPVLVAQKVVSNIYSGISTSELDLESAKICINMSTLHPSYAYLGGRILVSNLHKNTLDNFSSKIKYLHENTNMIHSDFCNWVLNHADKIDQIIDYNRDYLYDYFGFKTLEKSYLLKTKDAIVERPQDMYMRVAIVLSLKNYTNATNAIFETIKKTYDYMSLGYYTHATPTLFNAGTKHMQLSSCILMGTDDNLDTIAQTWASCAQLSKWACGIGLHVSNIRARNSLIKSTNGLSNGLVQNLKVLDAIGRYIQQGGRRPSSFAIYLEPHHPDIFEFLDLRKNFGPDTERARDLFLALWVSDLFMNQVKSDGDWYLMSPDDCPGLTDVWGSQYTQLYYQYVEQNKYRSKIKARKLWMAILEAQIETGMPYMGFKDAINAKCNQKNLGTIKSSNLCHEITEYSDHEEYAVCNLASISLKSCVKKPILNPDLKWIIYSKPNCKYCTYAKSYLSSLNIKYKEIQFGLNSVAELKSLLNKSQITFPQIFVLDESSDSDDIISIGGWSDLYKYFAYTFDYDKLYEIAYTAAINLNHVIDINYYPVPQAKKSNMKHRPVGLGIQGLADALVLMRIPFDSELALKFNAKAMETIYLASMTATIDLAKQRYEPMLKLMTHLKSNQIMVPIHYESDFQLNADEFNQLYHELKPTQLETMRDLDSKYLGAYSTFEGSPFSQGQFQFDLWSNPTNPSNTIELNYPFEWSQLRLRMLETGTLNSLMTALMPTASTSQILGNTECFEYFTNNIYTRTTNAGDFVMVNKYMVEDLIKIGLWSPQLKDSIIASNGSIQNIDQIPPELKNLYKTMWEIQQIWVLKGALARAPFVDQTQSMNIFMSEPDYQRLGSAHMWGWENGLKTGMYYLRTRPAIDAIKFTIDPNLIKKSNPNTNDEGCLNCSS